MTRANPRPDPNDSLAVLLAAYDASDRETARRALYDLLVSAVIGDALPRDPRLFNQVRNVAAQQRSQAEIVVEAMHRTRPTSFKRLMDQAWSP